MSEYIGPFRGLATYGERDHALFRGRDHAITDVTRMVRRCALTVVCGTPGIGKSSLLQAGVFHVLRPEFVPIWIRLRFAPGEPPLLDQVRATISEVLTRDKVRAVRARPPRHDEPLHEYCRHTQLFARDHSLVAPLFVFDQFEEIFTVGRKDRPGEVDEVMAAIAAICDELPVSGATLYGLSPPPARVILALREDYLAELEDHRRTLRGLLDDRYRLTSLNGAEALEVVLAPAGLIDREGALRIVRFVDSEGDVPSPAQVELADLTIDPPLLSLVCDELDRDRNARGASVVTVPEKLEKGMLAEFYRRAFDGREPGLQVLVEDHLVSKGARTTRSRDQALEVAGVTETGIDGLIKDARILRDDPRFKTPHIELVHDVLVQFAVKGKRDRAEAAARAQLEADKQRELVQLAADKQQELAALLTRHATDLREREEAFRKRRRRVLLIIGGVLLLAAVIGFVWWWRARLAERDEKNAAALAGERARARERDIENGELLDRLAHEALTRGDLTQAGDLALRARDLLPAQAWTTAQELMLTRAVNGVADRVAAVDHGATVTVVRLALRGDRLDTYGIDGMGRSWQTSSAGARPTAGQVADPGAAIVASHSSDWSLVVSADGGSELRSIGGTQVRLVRSSRGEPNLAATRRGWRGCVAPDDSAVAIWEPNGAIRAWKVTQGFRDLEVTPVVFAAPVVASHLICLDDAGFVAVRNDARGVTVGVIGAEPFLQQSAVAVAQVAASDDGSVIAVRMADGRAQVWRDGRLAAIEPASTTVARIAVSADGEHVVTIMSPPRDARLPAEPVTRQLVAVWSSRDRVLEFAVERTASRLDASFTAGALIVVGRQVEAWSVDDGWGSMGQITRSGLGEPVVDVTRDENGALVIAVARDSLVQVRRLGSSEPWRDRNEAAAGAAIAWMVRRGSSPAPDGVPHFRQLVQRWLTGTGFAIVGIRWGHDGTQVCRFADRVETWTADGVRAAVYPGRTVDAITNARGILWTCGDQRCQAWRGPDDAAISYPRPPAFRIDGDGATITGGGRTLLLPPVAPFRQAVLAAQDFDSLLAIEHGWVARQGDDTVGGADRVRKFFADAAGAPAQPRVGPAAAGADLVYATGSSVWSQHVEAQAWPPPIKLWHGQLPIAAIAPSTRAGGAVGIVDTALRVALVAAGGRVALERAVVGERPAGRHAVFAPSGHFYAMVSATGDLEVWSVDWPLRCMRYALEGHVVSRIVLADNLRVAAVVEDGLMLWIDLREPPVYMPGAIADVALTNQNLIVLRGGRARVYRIETAPLSLTLQGDVKAESIDLSPPGKRLAVARDGKIDIWKVEPTEAITRRFKRKDTVGYFRSGSGRTSFGPDASPYAWVRQRGVVHDVHADDNGRPITGARDCRFGASPHVIACWTDNDGERAIETIDVRDGKRLASEPLPFAGIDAVDQVPGGDPTSVAIAVRLFGASNPYTEVVVWSVVSHEFGTALVPGSPSVRVADDDHLWLLYDDGLLQRWRISEQRVVRAWGGARVLDLAVRGDQLLLALSRPGDGITVYTFAAGGAVQAAVLVDAGEVVDARFAATRGLLVGTTRGHGTYQWTLDAPRSKPVRIGTDSHAAGSLAVGDPFAAVAGDDDTVVVWPLLDPSKARTVSLDDATANALVFDPDGHLLAGACNDGTVRIWGIEQPRDAAQAPIVTELATVEPGYQGTRPAAIAFVPGSHGRALLTGNSGVVRRWSLGALPANEGRAQVDHALQTETVMRSGHAEPAAWTPPPAALQSLRPR